MRAATEHVPTCDAVPAEGLSRPAIHGRIMHVPRMIRSPLHFFPSFTMFGYPKEGVRFGFYRDEWALVYQDVPGNGRLVTIFTKDGDEPRVRAHLWPSKLVGFLADLIAVRRILLLRRADAAVQGSSFLDQIVDPSGNYVIDYEQVGKADGTTEESAHIFYQREDGGKGDSVVRLDGDELDRFVNDCRAMLTALHEQDIDCRKRPIFSRVLAALTGR